MKINLKQISTAALVSSVAFIFSGCKNEPELKTDMQKASYAIGQQIGKNMKSQKIDFDPEVLSASLKAAAEGKPSLMKDEEMSNAMMKLQESVMKKQQELAEKNKSDGVAFLEKNKTAEGVKVTTSGLQYKIEKEGTGKTPGPNDTVKAIYTGTLITGEKFDSSADHGGQPAEFPLSGVIKGWTEGLQLIQAGGKIKLFVPPDLGYGPSARPGIPGNSVLVFDIELVDVIAAAPPAPIKKGKNK
jgi:FKBP-type peptidyl-prolyl cis-trans isomerase